MYEGFELDVDAECWIVLRRKLSAIDIRRPEIDPINLRLSQQRLETIELNHNNLSPSFLAIALVACYLIPLAGTSLLDCLVPEHAGSPSYSEEAVSRHSLQPLAARLF